MSYPSRFMDEAYINKYLLDKLLGIFVLGLLIAFVFVIGYKYGIQKGLDTSLKWNSKVMANDFAIYYSKEQDPIMKKMFDEQSRSHAKIYDGVKDIADPYSFLMPVSYR